MILGCKNCERGIVRNCWEDCVNSIWCYDSFRLVVVIVVVLGGWR